MKNYVSLIPVTQTDGMDPPTLLFYAFFFSPEEAFQYVQDNGLSNATVQPPIRFLLNKWNLARIIAAFPWGVQNDGSFPDNPGVYTRDPEQAQDWGGDDQGWLFDPADEASQRAHDAAEETREPDSTGSGSGGGGSVCQVLGEMYSVMIIKGCTGFAVTVRQALEKCVKGTLTDADINKAFEAYSACVG